MIASPKTDTSRRTFLKQCVIGTITVYSAPLLFSSDQFKQYQHLKELQNFWKGDNIKPKFRFDAIAKVTGEKIYGRDYRSRDIVGWPKQQSYAMILRCNQINKIFKNIDLSSLENELQPNKVITANDLEKDNIDFPEFFGKNMLLKQGMIPEYQGHEVAILIFDTFEKFKRAKNQIEFNDNIIQYEKNTSISINEKDPYGIWRIIREESKQGTKYKDQYSTLQDGLIFPKLINHKPKWPKKGNRDGNSLQKGIFYANKLHNDIKVKDWYVLNKTYQTQSIDPMMLEPEAFNGWYDRENETIHLVLTTQSPGDFYKQAGEMLSKSTLGQNIKKLIVHSPYIGGGFGGKDHTPFPYYGLLTLLYSSKPISLSNNRYEQFQSGIKRHPFYMKHKLAFDKKTKKIKGLVSDMTVDGGGRANFSSSVTMVGASALQSIYYIPRNDLLATVYPSTLPTAGSMRGYGSLQTMASMEMMMNEAAADLGIDPFELRKINIFKSGDKNTQGAVPNGAYRYLEMLDLAEKHPIWVNKERKKIQFEKQNVGKKYGVGFSMVSKDYGTGAEAPSSSVEITPNGKIIVKVASMEMGTGTDTSQGALISRYLGNMADEVVMAEIEDFQAMQLIETDDPYLISQEKQDEMQKNPQWTPMLYIASSASQSSYFQSHTTAICAKLILKYGLFPAAVEIWKKSFFNSAYASIDFNDVNNAYWNNGKLTVSGYPPLDIKVLAKKAHEMGLVTAVMTHGFNRWAWASANFNILEQEENLFIDALAIKYGEGASKEKKSLMNSKGYHVINRTNIDYPKTSFNNAMVTYYTPCATLVELAISEGSGEIEILGTHSWLEPGHVHVKELVEGQLQGGIAMGIGHALYEYLPLDENGAGKGNWNLNRYHVPLAKNVGVWNMKYTLLPPLSPSDPSKGLAEVVMIPIVSSIVEAVYHAIGKRFYHLPITPEEIVKEI